MEDITFKKVKAVIKVSVTDCHDGVYGDVGLINIDKKFIGGKVYVVVVKA